MKTLQRHDLVWLDPDLDVGSFAVDDEHADLVRNWVKQGRPLVVARQCDPLATAACQLRLGFTLPPLRTRVSVRALKSAVSKTSRPLLLRDAMESAPGSWRASMSRLQALCDKTGAVVRVYGSLSNQAVTGDNYIDAGSDLDLLIECNQYTQVHELLMALESLPSSMPRIDGEIFMSTGWSVAWRELAAAIRTGAPSDVLAKSNTETRMMRISDFLSI